MLKKPNVISGDSGFISHHMFAICYCMKKDMTILKKNYRNEESLSFCMDRFSMHNSEEQETLCTDFPKYVFQDIHDLLEKNFNQCHENNLTCAAFLSEHALANTLHPEFYDI